VPPLTVTFTLRFCAVVMLEGVGIAVTVGMVLAGAVTVTVALPDFVES
jgi:hypothetical protein